ncbi:MAG: hypothetical protein Q9M97_06565 [Candidatus Gracilibacteria bacterium]|nr:hypothetical protein [Candidatus Gracilibacteria bacterium]
MRNKVKKVISAGILFSVLFSIIQPINVNAFKSKAYNLTSSSEKISHVPIWLMTENQKNASKDRQLCKIAPSFDILNEDGTLNYTYYPQGCQPDITEEDNFTNDYDDNFFSDYTEEKNEVDVGADNFLKDLFGEDITENEDRYIEDNIDFSSASEEPIDDNSSESIESIDNILGEFFGKTNTESNLSLKGSKLIKAIRDFSQEKMRIKVGVVEANISPSQNFPKISHNFQLYREKTTLQADTKKHLQMRCFLMIFLKNKLDKLKNMKN